MKESKMSLNSVIVIIAVFAAIAFFFTVKLVKTSSYHVPVNEYLPIEGSDLAVRYSSLEKNGIYKGSETDAELKLEGTFGYDWGLVLYENSLYINEIEMTDLGMVTTKIIKVNTDSFDKEVVCRDAIIRGQCKSGEIVCITDYTVPSNNVETNPLCTFYRMFSSENNADKQITIIYIDPKTSQTVYSVRVKDVRDSIFNAMYVNKTLSEVQG